MLVNTSGAVCAADGGQEEIMSDGTQELEPEEEPKAESYTVTFKVPDGTCSVESKEVTVGETYGELPMPEKKGYVFEGWYLHWVDEESGEIVQQEIKSTDTVELTGDVNLFAHWTEASYRVTLDANGGTCSLESIDVTYTKAYGAIPNPGRDGYEFVCWYDAEDAGETAITETTTYMTAGESTLKAKWKARNFQVTFDPVGGTFSREEDVSKIVAFEQKYGELPTPTKENYNFTGWYDKAEEGSQITEESVYKDLSDVTLYAYWQGQEMDIQLDADGGTCETSAIQVIFGSLFEKLPIPEREGYNFLGWFDAENNLFTDTSRLTSIIDRLFAHWEKKEYTVVFDVRGGICDTEEIKVKAGEPYGGKELIELPRAERPGYTFEGWYDAETDGTRVESDTIYSQNGDSVLYAYWVANTYKVIFDAVGGTVNGENEKAVVFDERYGSLPRAERAGYTFEGWYDAETDGAKVEADTLYSKNEDGVLLAHWTAKVYTLTFNAMGGTCQTENGSATYDGVYGTLPIPAKAGYTFDGWYLHEINPVTGAMEMRKVEAATKVSILENISLYAHWKENPTLDSEPAPDSTPAPEPKLRLGDVGTPKITRNPADAAKVTIQWSAVANAQEYTVSFSTKKNSGYKKIKTVTGKTLKVSKSGLKRGATYYFKVAASMEQDGKTVTKENIVSYPCVPKRLKLKITKKGDQYQIYWGKLEKGIAGIEIRKNNKSYASTNKGTYKFYNVAQANAPKGTKFKVRTYFKYGKKKVYSTWSNTVKVK